MSILLVLYVQLAVYADWLSFLAVKASRPLEPADSSGIVRSIVYRREEPSAPIHRDGETTVTLRSLTPISADGNLDNFTGRSWKVTGTFGLFIPGKVPWTIPVV
jgi:hypothetical protein